MVTRFYKAMYLLDELFLEAKLGSNPSLSGIVCLNPKEFCDKGFDGELVMGILWGCERIHDFPGVEMFSYSLLVTLSW